MSNLDEELRQTIGNHESLGLKNELESAQVFAKSPAAGKSSTQSRRHLGLLLGLVAMGAAILFVVFSGFKQAAVYSKGVDELLRDKARFESRTVRVVGTLVAGTLARRSDPCEYRFKMQKNDAVMTVLYPQCVVPDTFRDVPGVKVEVTAEGQISADGTFRAQQIMAKCPSKYEMRGKSEQGQAIPHTLATQSGMVSR
jgi:cytochrome c-type biogenesis protein CcmE